MAVLTGPQRDQERDRWLSDVSRVREATGSVTKAQVRAIINALDDNLEAHWSDLITGIPPAIRSELGIVLIMDLLMAVARRRARILGKRGRGD